MDRISKLFGKKDEPAELDTSSTGKTAGPKGEINKSQAALHPESEAGAAEAASFGLKFTLETGEEYLFASLPITIGRGDDNDFILNHDTVSHAHALIYFDERVQDVCILDQGSLNGILIDGLPTSKNILHDGAKIRIGDAVVSFRDTGYIHGQ